MRRAALLAIVAALLACGDASARPKAPTAVRVSVDPDGSGPLPATAIRIRCTSSGDMAHGCRVLRRVPLVAFAPTRPPGSVCAQVWGGPERARVVGRLRGRAIDAHFDRSDACGMEQWQLAAPLLALP
jgi:hypothetical protein